MGEFAEVDMDEILNLFPIFADLRQGCFGPDEEIEYKIEDVLHEIANAPKEDEEITRESRAEVIKLFSVYEGGLTIEEPRVPCWTRKLPQPQVPSTVETVGAEARELLIPFREATENILFIGNPGAGKSTLLNGLIGEIVFKSGMSLGSGLTDTLMTEQQNGKLFMDVPGVADCKLEMQVKSAKAISQALRYEGNFHIFFVLTLESGRVRTDDVSMMKLVLDSAPIKEYGIIINNLGPKVARILREDLEPAQKIKSGLMGTFSHDEHMKLPMSTNRFFYIERDEALECEENALWDPLPEGFREFIDASPGQPIPKNDVKQIKLEYLYSNLFLNEEELTTLIHLLYGADSGSSLE